MFGFLAPIASAIGGAFTSANIGSTLAGIGSLAGGLAGLSNSGQRPASPRENLLSQAQGARQAAEEYGFNPLTMLQYGQTGAGAVGGGGGAPLASIQMITDGIRDISDVTSGDAARRRAKEELDLDMRRLALEQARSGVIIGPAAATNFPGSPSPLGRRAATYVQNGAIQGGSNAGMVAASAAMGQGSDYNSSSGDGKLRPIPETYPIDPRREVEAEEQKSHSGFITIDNPHIPFPIQVPTMDGDEPVQWYDTPSLALWGGLSGYNHYIGKPFSEKLAMPAYERAKSAISNFGFVKPVSSHGGPVVRVQTPGGSITRRVPDVFPNWRQ